MGVWGLPSAPRGARRLARMAPRVLAPRPSIRSSIPTSRPSSAGGRSDSSDATVSGGGSVTTPSPGISIVGFSNQVSSAPYALGVASSFLQPLNRGDVRVIQRREHQRFPLEALQARFILRESLGKEIAPPVDASGHYIVPEGGPFGPPQPLWTYTAPDKVSFFSTFISSAHRLSNGNTFICSGAQGRFFEVTPEGEIVWEYWSPYEGDANPNLNERAPRGVFRATKIPPDHPALAGRELKPLDPQPTP